MEHFTGSHGTSHPLQLTIEQQKAIPLVLSGKTDRDVAEEVGVTRETVNTWRNRNPFFIAAVNRARQELWSASRDRLMTLTQKAMNVLEDALDSGDSKAALAVLKMVNMNNGPLEEERSDNPDDILFAQCWDEAAREFWRNKRIEIATMDPSRLPFFKDPEMKIFLAAVSKYLLAVKRHACLEEPSDRQV